MKKIRGENGQAELPSVPREFLQENSQKVYDFAYYLLSEPESVEEVVIRTFRHFGNHYKKMTTASLNSWSQMEMRILLFSIAWERIQREMGSVAVRWVSGRDMRVQKMAEENLLRPDAKDNAKENKDHFREAVMTRFSKVDIDFRAPVVLRDVLEFPDEEVMRILKLRWGVYRHRLHRGRLELCEGLRGKPYAFKPAEVRS